MLLVRGRDGLVQPRDQFLGCFDRLTPTDQQEGIRLYQRQDGHSALPPAKEVLVHLLDDPGHGLVAHVAEIVDFDGRLRRTEAFDLVDELLKFFDLAVAPRRMMASRSGRISISMSVPGCRHRRRRSSSSSGVSFAPSLPGVGSGRVGPAGNAAPVSSWLGSGEAGARAAVGVAPLEQVGHQLHGLVRPVHALFAGLRHSAVRLHECPPR